MPGKIINVDIHDDIIDSVSDYIFNSDKKTALISGGRRPFLFIKKKLARQRGKSFFPPNFFTNEEFVERSVFDNTDLTKISEIEAAFAVFEIVKNETSWLLNGRDSFSSFIEWAFEILFFIEHLDLENISEEKLKTVKANAEIGYDVPDNINDLLINIFKIRKSFHNKLERSSKTVKGYSFLKAVSLEESVLTCGFDEIVLLAPFYLYKTEIEIFKKIYDSGKLIIFTQGDPKEYEILARLYSAFGKLCPEIKTKKDEYKLNVYSAFDDQSQGALLRNLIKNYSKSDMDKTVIIVPESKMLQSVLSEVSIVVDKYNVSVGYPAEKTTVFSLLSSVVKAQLSRKGECYYSKDIMNVLTNPLLKNLRFFGDSSISRIVAHKIEEALDQNSQSCLSGKMFISFEEIIKGKQLVDEITLTVTEAWKYVPCERIIEILKEIFDSFFVSWEKIYSLDDLSNALSEFLRKIYSLSSVDSYPLNMEAMELLLSLSSNLKAGEVSKVKFGSEDVFGIFKKLIKNNKITLSGSSLEGLQILGLLESRNLSYDNVFIVGMTDSAIPSIKKEYSLIPKDIMLALGIETIKKEFEIQKYHFNRLIARAKNLNLIYPDNDKDERSRFIEALIWSRQLENNDIDAVKVNKFVLPRFSIGQASKRKYLKTERIREYLKNILYTYSKIDVYLSCKLKFYFKYVLLLDTGIEVGQELSGGDIGNFVHDFLKNALNEKVDVKKLQDLEFEKEYFKKLENSFNLSPYFKFREDAFIIKEVLKHRMKNVLYYERQRNYGRIYACERKYASRIETASGLNCRLECKIDRIDISGKDYAIFDYKTGKVLDNIISEKYFKSLSTGYDRQDIKKAITSLQLPLYKYIFESETNFTVSECGLYDVRKAQIINFPDGKGIYEKCIEIIGAVLDEIISGENFEFDTEDKTSCKTCPYFYICR